MPALSCRLEGLTGSIFFGVQLRTWRWIFPSFSLAKVLPFAVPSFFKQSLASTLNLILPDDCRICSLPLREFSRIPVCRSCLSQPKPLEADHWCVTCGSPFLNAFPLDADGRCGLCRRGLAGFDAAYAFGSYEGTLRSLIHLLKYKKICSLSKPLGQLLAGALPRHQRFDVVTAVPMHWRRRWMRGFNQAELLAAEIGRHFHIPVKPLLKRCRPTPSQAGLTRAARRANVAGAFRVRNGVSAEGLRVLLVDDVMTTGATVSACASALKRGGAKHVTVITLARADRRLFLQTVNQPDRTPSTRSLKDA